MFVSKKRLEKAKQDSIHCYNKLRADLEFQESELRRISSLYNELDPAECIHNFNKWEQAKIEEQWGDLNGAKVVGYRDKQVRKCKKCGFMEAVKI